MGRTRTSPHRWNAEAGRYTDSSGRFVPKQAEVRALESRIDAGVEQVLAITAGVRAGVVTVDEWQLGVAVELRRMHTQAAALGRGGWQQMTPSDWGKIGNKLRREYNYLNGFAGDIDRLSDAQIDVRLELYVSGIWSSYWKGADGAMSEAGMTEERRVLTNAEHCVDCEALASLGWQPLGSLPVPGENTVCRHNCRCRMEYRKLEAEEEII